MLFAEGPAACPFVALENDRDRRADEPDPRHRCYAVPVPEPRALAHQRAYCLTGQFTACPIFSDWAVRAAARPVPMRPVPGPLPPEEQERIGAWATPPRWQQEDAAREAAAEAEPPPAAQSAAPASPPLTPAPATPAVSGGEIERLPSLPLDAPSAPLDSVDGEEAALPVQPAPSPAAAEPPLGDFDPAAERMQPPTYRSGATDEPVGRQEWDRRDLARAGQRSSPQAAGKAKSRDKGDKGDKPTLRREDVVPAWERGRYEAYPTLGRRLDLGGGGGSWLSRITTLFAVLAVLGLAVAVIILAPGLLGLAGPGSSPTPPPGAASPTPSGGTGSPAPTVSPSATPLPHETWQVYVIQSGDSICRIASRFGVTYSQLMGANPQISNPGFIRAGDQINVPPDDFVPPSPAPEATPHGNPCG